MNRSWRDRAIIGLVVIASALVIWLPFMLKIEALPGWGLDFSGGMETVFANFDGPNYVIVAKTWYDKEAIRAGFSNPLPLEYYPAHFPLYPATIALLGLVMPHTWAMLVSTQIGLMLTGWMFYELAKRVKLDSPLFLTLAFLFFPGRWVTVSHIGSPETWFAFFILGSLYFFDKKNYLLAGVMGALAQFTKSPAILLFAGYCLYFAYLWWKERKLNIGEYIRALPLLLIPAMAPLLFWFYSLRTGDFWAYFNSGDNFHLFLPPFSIFAPKGQVWVGDFWLEDVLWIWLVYLLGTIRLWQKGLTDMAAFASTFLMATLMVAHRDVARYILPISGPVLLGLEGLIGRKEIKILTVVLLIPILLYTWNFMLHNASPVADWTPYL